MHIQFDLTGSAREQLRAMIDLWDTANSSKESMLFDVRNMACSIMEEMLIRPNEPQIKKGVKLVLALNRVIGLGQEDFELNQQQIESAFNEIYK